MTLGKNLKKKQPASDLGPASIRPPSSKSKKVKEGSGKIPTTVIGKGKVKIPKKKLIEKAEQSAIASKPVASKKEKMMVAKSARATKVVAQSVSNRHYLIAAEYEEHQRLKDKFKEGLKNLAGKRVHMIVFALGAEEYAIEIDYTRGVIVTPEISKVPHTPDYIKGVADIRGTQIVAIDLAMKFDLARSHKEVDSVSRYTMVVENDRWNVGILVDHVPTTLIVRGEEINSVSSVMADTALNETYIKGVVKLDARMIFLLDIDELIEGEKLKIMPEVMAEA